MNWREEYFNRFNASHFITLIAVLFLSSTGLLQAGKTGHSTQSNGKSIKEIRSLTENPENIPQLRIPYQKNSPFPSRDEGEAEILWQEFDENAITDNVVISGDGGVVAVGFSLNDERLEIRSAENGELLLSYEVESGAGNVAVSDNGEYVGYSALNNVWVFRNNGEQPVFNFNMGDYYPGPIALSNDAQYLLTTGVDPEQETNRVWAFRNLADEPEWTFEVDPEEAFGWYGVTIANQAGLAVVNGKYHLYVLNLETGELIWDEPTYNTESGASISDDGTIIAAGSLTGRVRVFGWSRENGEYFELWHYNFTGVVSNWVTICEVSPDGRWIAAGTLDFLEEDVQGRYALFDAYGDGLPLWISDPLGDEVSGIDFSADGSIMAVVNWGDVENGLPDLLVHETHNPEPFYRLVTPGSLSGVDVSDNGSRIIAGGKSVHNRVFGRGGRYYLIETTRTGGGVAGAIIDADRNPVENVEITAANNPYTAYSDADGVYRLSVEVDNDHRDVVVYARKKGYMDDWQAARVPNNELVHGIDFTLHEADPPPENLAVSRGQTNFIHLEWTPYNEQRAGYGEKRPVLAATGKAIPNAGITPWDNGGDLEASPKRDNALDAERINIYRSALQGGPYRLIASVDGNQSRYTDRHRVFPQRLYHYVITADFGEGKSAYSAEETGWVNDEFLNYALDLQSFQNPPEIDGIVDDNEWQGAQAIDISDVYGYDLPDTAGSVTAYVGFSDQEDKLYFGFKYHIVDELSNRMGVGIYIDDDRNGEWTYERPGSEGNYWGYWVDEEPKLTYRSLSGPPYNYDPYLEIENPALAFNERQGEVELEVALPLGFHNVEEIALYAPDYEIGLGMFAMIRDEEENPIFNGWWPQNLFSIVTNPYQYGGVHIPADLIAPPVPPGELEVFRDEDVMALSWTDPTMALDSAEVEGLAGITIKRNNVIIHEARPGEESWFDENVVEYGWYEYSAAGWVVDGENRFRGPYTDPAGMYAVRQPDVDILSQDDSTVEAFYIVDYEGEDNRFAVKYPLDGGVDTIGVYWVDFIPHSPDPIDIYIAEDANGQPGERIGETARAAPNVYDEFYRFHFPGTDQPRIIIDPDEDNACWVILKYLGSTPSYPAIGVDRDGNDVDRNKYFQQGAGWQEFAPGRLMVRIGVGRPPAVVPPEDEPEVREFYLGQNYPNPFNAKSLIPIGVNYPADFMLKIYAADGRYIKTIDFGRINTGYFNLSLDAANLTAGSYFAWVTANAQTKMIRFTVLK